MSRVPVSGRTGQQTFDIRPTPQSLPAGFKPDELMIDSTGLPPGSSVTVYLPEVSAASVLEAAGLLYATNSLSQLDPNTLSFSAGGITYMPIPVGTGANFAGLLSISLGPSARPGGTFTVLVRQVSGKTTAVIVRGDAERNLVQRRYILGTFKVTLPVKSMHVVLPNLERSLSILLWIKEAIPASNRWYPVFQRYLGSLALQVEALGGDPGTIIASPSGEGRKQVPGKHHGSDQQGWGEGKWGLTGKVEGIAYDRFGDFEGFLFKSEGGENRTFSGREPNMLELVKAALSARINVTVVVGRDAPHVPVTIILRDAPHGCDCCEDNCDCCH
jgi:hypothetical protein